ncbi:MAG: FUSC family protein [Paracoccaceae bacterium]
MSGWSTLRDIAAREWRDLITINPSDRPWQMPVSAAIASGAPVFLAAAMGRLAEGVIGAVAGLTFLYLPRTALHHRMAMVMAAAFGMICCYTIGMLGHLFPPAIVPLIGLTAMLATMVCRYFRIGPPGSMFFIMACAIGAYSPGELATIPERAGILALACIFTCTVAFFYSLHSLSRRAPLPLPPPPVAGFGAVWLEPVVIGAFVGGSLAVAQLMGLEKPYWVPISCLAIVQGITLRAAWNRQVHRILGTALGLVLAWGLLSLVRGPWEVAVAITGLTFIIETAVVRHYGFAVIFITPMTLLLAEAPTLGHADITLLMQARFVDTVVGACIGFAGAACLLTPRIRDRIARGLRRIIPERLIEGE